MMSRDYREGLESIRYKIIVLTYNKPYSYIFTMKKYILIKLHQVWRTTARVAYRPFRVAFLPAVVIL